MPSVDATIVPLVSTAPNAYMLLGQNSLNSTKPVAQYLNEIRALADEIAIAGFPTDSAQAKSPSQRQNNYNSSNNYNGNNNRKNYQQSPNENNNWPPNQSTGNSNRRQNWRSSISNNNKPRVQCQLCEKFGDVAKVCRSRTHNANEPQANFSVKGSSGNSNWVMDTGASHYITSDIQNLQA
nr:putative uncharacterized protein DDB_G0283051 [Nicotiana tomentosiformis]